MSKERRILLCLKCAAITLIAIALVALLAACAGKEEAPPRPPEDEKPPTIQPPAPEQPVTITWSFWGDPWEVEVNKGVIEVFEADYPNIEVEILHEPWPTYFDKAEEWFASENPPDVLFLENIPVYAKRGLLENLDTYIQRDDYDVSDFYPNLLQIFKYKGSLYGLPRDNDTKVIFYNEDLFDEVGVPYPESNWEWDDLRDLSKKLTKREGGEITQYGFAYEPEKWWRLWVWQNGGEVYDDDFNPSKTLIDSWQAMEAIQFLADLTNVDKVTPRYEVQRTSLNIGSLFQEGKLAMAFGNHALVPGFLGTTGLRWDVAPLPRKRFQTNAAGGGGYAISRRSKNKEAAWTFLKWLESPKGQAIFTELGVAVPARRSVGHADIFLKHGTYNAEVFLDETERGRPSPIFTGCSEVESLFNEGLKPIWKGEKNAEEVIPELVPRVNELLRKYR